MLDERFEAILRSVAEIPVDLVITGEQDLRTELGVDSLKLMDLIVNVEEEFDVELSEEVPSKVNTVDDLWREVSRAVV